MTGVSIDGMVKITLSHGLVVVPVDVQESDMAPKLCDIERLMNERTKVLVVANIFGAVVPLSDLARVCRSRGVLLVSDSAESYVPNAPCNVQHDADVIFYSFGTIKTSTSLGGSVTLVKSPSLHSRMCSLHATYPPYKEFSFLCKAFKVAALHALSSPFFTRSLSILSIASACRTMIS